MAGLRWFDGFKFGMALGSRETGIACFTDP